jgi:hypothetical protein
MTRSLPSRWTSAPSRSLKTSSILPWTPSRVEFLARGGACRGATPAQHRPAAFRCKIEVSTDGKSYATALDKTNNSVTRYTEFDEIPPVRYRYVRLPRRIGPPRETCFWVSSSLRSSVWRPN